MTNSKKIWIGLLLLVLAGLVFGQSKIYEGPEDPAADPDWVRAGYMNGNRVFMYFENTTQVSNYEYMAVSTKFSRWPNDYTGVGYLDLMSMVVGGEVYITQDSIPVTDLAEVQRLAALGEIDTLFYAQGEGFSGLEADENAVGTVKWGMYPVPFYCNPYTDYPAMSNDSLTWPITGWPSAGRDVKWQGEWNGRFGRGKKYADLETFFVANDAQDEEYIVKINSDTDELRDGEETRYYPRPGKFIGDIHENVTRQKGLPWGGLGLRVAVRGFQWNNPEARDIIFWEYGVSNVSDYDLPTCGFGYWIDNDIGGDTGNDAEAAWFNDLLDLSYVWETQWVGHGGRPTGLLGVAYLENPGQPTDGLDNDMDGIVDEKRDNDAGTLIGPTEGYVNLDDFLNFYKLSESDLAEHWSGDEDQDWRNGNDVNGNGLYATVDDNGIWTVEPGENAGDDVGLDGVGPMDLNYFGPDQGEGNGKPDWLEGVGSEPNFAATDVSETDMIGLTSFQIFDWPQWQEWNLKLGYDRDMWEAMDQPKPERTQYNEGAAGPGSLYEIFASTRFKFPKGRTERISMAMLFSFDTKSALSQDPPQAPKMFRIKETAQVIYERDYRFAQPPLMPTLKATAGDEKVVLTWDSFSDRFTREPFLDNKNDFEGYKVFKATDKTFQDAEIVTDGFGNRMAKAPVFQCDIIDNRFGYAEYGIVEGTSYYLGDDTGIRHYFVDDDVKNGVTYYYAVVAYDYGVEEYSLAPTENNVVLELGEDEEVVRKGINVAIVTPGQQAAGFVDATVSVDLQRTSSTVTPEMILPRIADPGLTKDGHTYKVNFQSDTVGHVRSDRYRSVYDAQLSTYGFAVYDETEGGKLVYQENPDWFPEDHLKKIITENKQGFITDSLYLFRETPFFTDVFDGLQMRMAISSDTTVEVNMAASGWVTGYSPMNVITGAETKSFAYDYEIVFTGDPAAYTTLTERTTLITDTGGAAIPKKSLLMEESFDFYVINKSFTDSTGEYIPVDMIVHDINESGVFEWNEDVILVGHSVVYNNRIYWAGTVFTLDWRGVEDEALYPAAGDIYRLSFKRPLSESDQMVFTVNPSNALDKSKLKTVMDSIRVVPNPYIATNLMETAVINKRLNQRRRIMFTHVPADCEIRIFTSSGLLVDEIFVNNAPSDGTVFWDLKSREDLEVAAGMYVYYVKSNETGDEKLGKFAVIK